MTIKVTGLSVEDTCGGHEWPEVDFSQGETIFQLMEKSFGPMWHSDSHHQWWFFVGADGAAYLVNFETLNVAKMSADGSVTTHKLWFG